MVVTGVYYALGLIAGGLAAGYFTNPWLGAPFYLLAAFCLYFFRDPDREIPHGPYAVSPADGKVVQVKKESETLTRVSIFLNVFDVHVNRSPIAGKITNVLYKRGRFLVASKELASAENEQNTVTVEGQDGVEVVFSQIAGLIARRIVFWKRPGDFVTTGERVGLIRFGSRVDLLFGPQWAVKVRAGERVSAGSSILAERVG
ncbi:MAG: phosphatidylserine decarboxylase [Bryobacteraceae bacterium]|nr:phosphatidylserine decarboxylase [Bryobacteraceae bacterium]